MSSRSGNLQVGRVHRQRRTHVRSLVVDIGRFTRSMRRLSSVPFLQVGALDDDAAIDLLDDITTDFEQALQEIRSTLQPGQDERLILTVQGVTADGNPVNVYINEREHWNVDGNTMAGRLLAALNSYQTIANNFRVVAAVRPRSVEPLRVAGKTSYRGDFAIFIQSKKSVVAIHNEDESEDACVYQWLALGMAQIVRDRKLTFLEMNHKTFDSLTKSGTKQTNRRKWSQRIADFLGHSLGPVSSFELFEEMSHQLGVNLVVFDFWTHLSTVYPQSLSSVDTTLPFLFGIVQVDEESRSFSHIDFVSKVEALAHGKHNRFCYQCLSFYTRKKLCSHDSCRLGRSQSCRFCHCCVHVCGTCRSTDCEKGEGEGHSSVCGTCQLPIFGPRCFEAHEQNEACSPLYTRKCTQCGQNEHPSGMKCYQYKCRQCSEIVDFGNLRHQCWLRREKMRGPHERYIVYDFECMIDPSTQNHVPYLATLWFPFESPILEPLIAKYQDHVHLLPDSNPVFVFWGPEGIRQFFCFIREKNLKKHIFYAHNARAYDHILIKQSMMRDYRLYSVDIKRGQKFLQMYFPDLQITFRDSLSFIPSSLRSMSRDFKIDELAKGHFPHSVMTTDFFARAAETDFICDLPSRDAFETDFDEECDRMEVEQWLDRFYAENQSWNMKQEAIDYCISDTVLLGKVIQAFRQQCMEMTEKMQRPVDFEGEEVPLDPFTYVTLPSAIMSFYLSQMLPLASIPVLDRYPSLMDRLEEEWLLYEEHQRDCVIQRKILIGGASVSGKTENEIFMFVRCYQHGCSKCFPQTGFNNRFRKNFEELRLVSEKRLRDLRQSGLHVIVQRECDWRSKRVEGTVKLFLQEYDQWVQARIPLDPREAYKGGKSEVYKLMTPSRISMVDFVSQYPTSMLGESYDPYEPATKVDWWLPTGFPEVIQRPVSYQLDHERLGIAKVKIHPPFQLYAPFLSLQVPSRVNVGSYEVLYGLCRTCMTERRGQSCTHSIEERSFIGTWTLTELRHAVSLGYQVQEWIEVWEYPTKSKELFRSFIVPFMKNKICSKASGLVCDGVFTEKGHKVAQYLFEITGESVTPEDFSNDPARRTVAKLIQNAFTGKWGQKEEYANSGTFYSNDMPKCMKIINDPNINITYLEVLDEQGEMISLQYEPFLGSSTTYQRKNDHIVAHITAYGRIMLNRLEQKLGEKMLYCDTDSAYHEQYENQSPPYISGFRTGDLELELPDAQCWRALGRKSYSYLKPDGKLICRQKGVTIRNSVKPLFHVDKLHALLAKMKMIQTEHSFMRGKEWDDLCRIQEAEIIVPQRLFSTIVQEDQVPVKRTRHIEKRIRFHCFATKRWFQWPSEIHDNSRIDSLPYGYRQ